MRRFVLTVAEGMIAPRFDLAAEVLIVAAEAGAAAGPPKSMLLPGPSADDLCGLILKEEASVLICGGIEEEHYQFLTWKKIKVLDRVIGKANDVLRAALDGRLKPGEIVRAARGGRG